MVKKIKYSGPLKKRFRAIRKDEAADVMDVTPATAVVADHVAVPAALVENDGIILSSTFRPNL
jgi:hypothetical protein